MLVLEVRNVHRHYGRGQQRVEAVRGVSLALEAGEFVAVVGPSGCGKSTLLHLAGAMDRPSRGEIRLEGSRIDQLGEEALTRIRRERVGFVFQFFNLLPTLTVLQNVGLPRLLAGEPVGAVLSEAARLADRVGLAGRRDHFPQQLSGGEAQRAAIARALIHRPPLLVADEPTGNLDSDNGTRVMDLLLEVRAEHGMAMLLATHDERVALAAHRILHLRDGRIDPAGAAPAVVVRG